MQIDDRILKASVEVSLDPELVDWHLEAVHGWEPHDIGYIEKGLAGTIACLLGGGCEPHKKTPAEWAKELKIIILDPDGWRRGSQYGEFSMDIHITREEFDRRASISTTGPAL